MKECIAIQGERDGVLFIIAPIRPFTPVEIEALKGYLAGGNTIFLADESFAGNLLLAALDSSIRISGQNLSSIEREYQNPALILAKSRTEHPLLEGVDTLLLNHPAALTGGETLVASTLLSWIDEDGNQQINEGEKMGRSVILARETLGGGEVLVLSDPSIFINGMTGLENPGTMNASSITFSYSTLTSSSSRRTPQPAPRASLSTFEKESRKRMFLNSYS